MTTPPPSLTTLTTYLLSRTGKSARTRFTARLADRGLRLWHMAVLAALADFGPHSQRELAERLAIDPSDIVKILDELGTGGHVERARDTTDRRRFSVSLTDPGRALLATLTAEAEQVQEQVLAPLSPTERAQLHTLLARLHPFAD
ncbi:MarR family winged helix-turn-helix transcriptional regulator [Kitasatospora sp. NPDC002227]|uniref:MarR family winged helix-turn-helix transcriptional regulator n=1 Tax=Kitasatospora sp. NPDC002227 TaxID=3154773 RepID=UPI003321BA32